MTIEAAVYVIGTFVVLLILFFITKETLKMSAAFDNLIIKVTAIEDRADALIALVNGIAQQLRDNATDPAAVNALADRLDAQTTEIQAAIDANTPTTP